MRSRWPALLTIAAAALAAWLLGDLLISSDPIVVEVAPAVPEREAQRPAARPANAPAQANPPEATESTPLDESLVWGARFFDDAIRYVSRGRDPIDPVRTLYLGLDAKGDFRGTLLAGRQRVWLESPSRLRVENDEPPSIPTRILDGDAGWLVRSDGAVVDLTSAGADREALLALRQDRDRAVHLSRLITLASFKGPAVDFRFEGYTSGSGTYDGHWLKVTRTAPDEPAWTFWLAYERESDGTVHATWPGIVRIEDDALDTGKVDYIFKEWDAPSAVTRTTFRYPRRIEVYDFLPGLDLGSIPRRRLFAIVDRIDLNGAIDSARFQPPR